MTSKGFIIFLFIVLIFALFQVSVLDCVKIFGVKPDLFLISVVLAGIYFEWKWALFISLFCGILKDSFGINTFGINTFVFPFLCLLIIQMNKKLSLDNFLFSGIVIFIITLIYATLTLAISLHLNNIITYPLFLRIAFLEALYTSLIFLLLFRVIKSRCFINKCEL